MVPTAVLPKFRQEYHQRILNVGFGIFGVPSE